MTIAPYSTRDTTIIDDAIILIGNMAPHGKAGLQYVSDGEGLAVSFCVFQWSLAVCVYITDAGQIDRMYRAIHHNINVIQPAMADYERANWALTAALFHGADAVKKAYTGMSTEGEGYARFKADYLAPLQHAYDAAMDRLFQGERTLHPNRYLQTLGVKRLRLESIQPLCRD